jgi:hypothetical protein
MLRLLAPVLLLAAVASGQEEKRLVIAFFDSAGLALENDTEDPIHQVLEMPLNYLGMVVRRHDIREGPPPAEWLPRARAVLTFFSSREPAPPWLWPWLEKEVPAHGLRVLHFGDFGPLLYPAGKEYDPRRITAWLKRFGLDYDDFYEESPVGMKVRYRDPKLCAYEADPRRWAVHHGPVNKSAANQVWVTTHAPSDPRGDRTPVVSGAWGAVALDPWVVRIGGADEDRRWFLDPFAFFAEVLALDRVPAPDPSFLNGRRMFFLHLDGDGFESLSTVQPGEYCAKVMLDEVFLRYQLPYTLSIIVRSLTDDYDVAEPTDRMLLARRIFMLPNVEVASHGVLHPLKWDVLPDKSTKPHTITWYPSLKNYTYNQVNEVVKSITFINERLLVDGKRCRVMLWTGSAIPPEPAIHACDDVEVWNLNGGIYRWDGMNDSVGFVPPWTRLLGTAVQVYPGQTNENVYNGYFTTMPGAYELVDETIERTGGERVLKPANIYIHFYSAENPIRLRSVQRLIGKWAFERKTAPVFASTYCRAVHSATVGAHVIRTEDGWSLRDFGDCRTVRIDGEARNVDFTRSKGLLGARRRKGSLLIHLNAPDADVVLAENPPRSPHIEEANHVLREVALTADAATCRSEAFSRREIVFAGFGPGEAVTVEVDGEARAENADAAGRVTVILPEPGNSFVTVLRE